MMCVGLIRFGKTLKGLCHMWTARISWRREMFSYPKDGQ